MHDDKQQTEKDKTQFQVDINSVVNWTDTNGCPELCVLTSETVKKKTVSAAVCGQLTVGRMISGRMMSLRTHGFRESTPYLQSYLPVYENCFMHAIFLYSY